MANDKIKTPDERWLELQERQLAIQEAQLAAAEAQRKAAEEQAQQTRQIAQQNKPKQLNRPAGRSAFNPRGEKDYPMPPLKCVIYAPWQMEPRSHGLDREEVELFNALEPGEYTVELVDGSTATVAVEAVRNKATGALDAMWLKPDPNWNHENKGRFRPMREMLREMLTQQGFDTSTILSMKAERRKVADYLAADDKAAAVAAGALPVSVDA